MVSVHQDFISLPILFVNFGNSTVELREDILSVTLLSELYCFMPINTTNIRSCLIEFR